MKKEIINQIQEAHRIPYRINPRGNMPRHILMKLTKTKHKERILKAAREKQQVTYKGNPIYLTSWSFSRNSAGQKGMAGYVWSTERKNLQPRLLYLARVPFKIDGEIKTFSDKKKLRELSITKPDLQEMLKGLIWSRNTKEEKRSTKLTPNN